MDHSALNDLYSNFSNPNSVSFASIDVEQVLRDSNSDATRHPVTRDDIKRFQLSLESISRQRERRILKGRKRKASFRKWIVYSPRHLILGDLAFLRKLDATNNSYTIIAVFMDAHSRSINHPFNLILPISPTPALTDFLYPSNRLIHLSTQRSKTSAATFNSFKKALNFFTSQGYPNTYRLFNSDKGGEFRGSFFRY